MRKLASYIDETKYAGKRLRLGTKKLISEVKAGPRGWLVLLFLAALLHIVTTTSVFIIGRAALMPSQFTRDGLGAFASDSFFYQQDIISLSDKLGSQGPGIWLRAVAPLHIKLYSLSYFPFHWWATPNILTIEPLNLFYYLAILWLVYKLGELVFDRRAGLIAMAMIGLWPSFLMHTTQLIRDPLLIVAVLAFVLVVSSWLAKGGSLRWHLMAAVPACLAVLTIWIVRLAMWDAVRAIFVMGFVLLVVRHIQERRLFAGHIANAIVLSVAIVTIPQSQTVKSQQRREADVGRPLIAERAATMSVPQRIDERRHAFAKLRNSRSSASASNLDDDVEFDSIGDFVRYVPRAAEIGFFAPFPNMWFAQGSQVGRTGRLLSGLETSATYLLEMLAVFGLWQKRKNLVAILLGLTIVSALTGLGMIVLNIGSLYRFRYPFLMLIMVFAAGGTLFLLQKHADRKRIAAP